MVYLPYQKCLIQEHKTKSLFVHNVNKLCRCHCNLIYNVFRSEIIRLFIDIFKKKLDLLHHGINIYFLLKFIMTPN